MLEIIQLGDDRLLAPNTDFTDEEILSDATRSLVDKAFELLDGAGGYGLSFPQIGVNKRGFVIQAKPQKLKPNQPTIDPIAVFNPRIVSISRNYVSAPESCLSVCNKGIVVDVMRYAGIELSYLDITAEVGYLDLTEQPLFSRIVQHEMDHLDRRLILDRGLPYTWTSFARHVDRMSAHTEQSQK